MHGNFILIVNQNASSLRRARARSHSKQRNITYM